MEDFRAVKQENPTSPWVDPNEEKCQIKFQAVVALETLNDLEKQREKDAVARNAAIKAANKEKRKREEERRQARKTGKLLGRMAVEKRKPNKASRQDKKTKMVEKEKELAEFLGAGLGKLRVGDLDEKVDELRAGIVGLEATRS